MIDRAKDWLNVMHVEDVVCSKTRLKILKILLKSAPLSPTQIAKRVGTDYAKALKHLKILENEGILTHTMFGKRIRFYKLNEFSPRAKAVRDLIEAFTTD
jgi:predicted ArsR family transcriptional regulator